MESRVPSALRPTPVKPLGSKRCTQKWDPGRSHAFKNDYNVDISHNVEELLNKSTPSSGLGAALVNAMLIFKYHMRAPWKKRRGPDRLDTRQEADPRPVEGRFGSRSPNNTHLARRISGRRTRNCLSARPSLHGVYKEIWVRRPAGTR